MKKVYKHQQMGKKSYLERLTSKHGGSYLQFQDSESIVCDFILGYTVNSRLVYVTVWDPVLKDTNTKKKKIEIQEMYNSTAFIFSKSMYQKK